MTRLNNPLLLNYAGKIILTIRDEVMGIWLSTYPWKSVWSVSSVFDSN